MDAFDERGNIGGAVVEPAEYLVQDIVGFIFEAVNLDRILENCRALFSVLQQRNSLRQIVRLFF